MRESLACSYYHFALHIPSELLKKKGFLWESRMALTSPVYCPFQVSSGDDYVFVPSQVCFGSMDSSYSCAPVFSTNMSFPIGEQYKMGWVISQSKPLLIPFVRIICEVHGKKCSDLVSGGKVRRCHESSWWCHDVCSIVVFCLNICGVLVSKENLSPGSPQIQVPKTAEEPH